MNQQQQDRVRKNLRLYAKEFGIGDDAVIGVKSVGTSDFKAVHEKNTGRDEYLAIATTEDIDLDGEVVESRGLSTDYIRRNMKLFADHEYGMQHTAGSIRAISPYPDKSSQRGYQVRLSLNDTPIGQITRKIIEDSGFIGLSIGFTVSDRGPASEQERSKYRQDGKEPVSVVRKGDWFELSATPLPCNVSCRTGEVVRSEKSINILDELLRKGTLTREEAAAVGMTEVAERRVWRVDAKSGIRVPVKETA
ncbi:MAG: hypothetical protein AAGA55_11480 [Planctomycetota bacterium]